MSRSKDSEASPFVAYLQSIEKRGDRATMAALRRCLGRELRPSPDAMRVVVPWLKDDFEDQRLRHFLVAGLFALHPLPGGHGNFGAVMRQLVDHESACKRFEALLDADLDQLPHRLRQALSLAKSKAVPVDWHRLYRDLGQWGHEKRYIQFQWAQAYWRPTPGQIQVAPLDAETTSEE